MSAGTRVCPNFFGKTEKVVPDQLGKQEKSREGGGGVGAKKQSQK